MDRSTHTLNITTCTEGTPDATSDDDLSELPLAPFLQ